MSAPRKGKYSPFSEFLSGAQAEQDELIQHNEQLMEQLRLKEGQLTELSRQMAKLCQVSSEQTSALTTDPASTGEGSETSVQSKRQLKISADGIRDALSHLDRFSIDAAQIVCRRFRYTVENMLTGVCLRPLDIVEMEPDRGQRLEDASEYLFCLIRSATFQQLTLERLTLRDEFFAVSHRES
ncbi:hypothetical protein AAVH_06671 [Aphelenchoides avenae]|nr:hypothetical protein AAVH_06671 [Aphelenchus avenae]